LSDRAKLKIKVAPNASKDQIVGWLGDTLKIRVRAQPEKGKANAAVIALLAERMRIPAKNISVSTGLGSRDKIIEIAGMNDGELREKLANV
jgi:uncharacterized protein (TIGR00251 family)